MIKKHTSILLLCLTISVTAFTDQVWADQKNTDVSGVTTTVPSIEIDVNNPYITAGIDDAKVFSEFYIGLKKVVSEINAVDNPYEVAGIDDPKAFTQFLSKLQNSVQSNDKKAVAELMYYPLNVNQNGKTTKIYTPKQFISKYDRVITKKVKQQILAQKADQVFVNSDGVMIGNGEMWINQFGKKIAVFAVNL